MPSDILMPKNESLYLVVESNIERAFVHSLDTTNNDTTSIRYLLQQKILSPAQAAVEIFKWMMLEDLRSYERYFQSCQRKVSRANTVAHLRAVIVGDRTADNVVLSHRIHFRTPEGLKSNIYPIINKIPTTLGDWWAGDEPLLRAVMLRCFSKTSDIHEYVANFRVTHLEQELETVRSKYTVLKNTTPTLSHDYNAVTTQLSTINEQLAQMQQQVKQKDVIIAELNVKLSKLEQSNQHLQDQLTRLLSNNYLPPKSAQGRKQVRFLANTPSQPARLPLIQS